MTNRLHSTSLHANNDTLGTEQIFTSSNEQPTGDFSGNSIHPAAASREAQEIKESALDHFMEIVGDPLKAITSIPTHIQSALERRELVKKLKIEKDFFSGMRDSYANRGLENKFDEVMAAYEKAIDSNLSSGTHEALQHCKEAAAMLLDQAIQKSLDEKERAEIYQKKESYVRNEAAYLHHDLSEKFRNLIQACDVFLTAEAINDEMKKNIHECEQALDVARARVVEQEAAARRLQQESKNMPGAFHVTAAEAAAEGNYQAPDALRAVQETEAIMLPQATAHAPHRVQAVAKAFNLKKANAAAQAETPMMMAHGIPVAEASIVTPTESALASEDSSPAQQHERILPKDPSAAQAQHA